MNLLTKADTQILIELLRTTKELPLMDIIRSKLVLMLANGDYYKPRRRKVAKDGRITRNPTGHNALTTVPNEGDLAGSGKTVSFPGSSEEIRTT